jgi:type III pantothenate kinase
MKLAVDIGNTNIVIGAWQEGQWVSILRMESRLDIDASAYESQIRAFFLEEKIISTAIEQVILSSVVAELTLKVENTLALLLGIKIVVLDGVLISKLKLGSIDPYELGSDLAANAIGAFERYGMACIVVDFGTALTYTSVNNEGHISGVAIAPGVRTSMKSLSSNTSKLPEIPLEIPEKVLGKNTVEALQSGIMQGYVGMVRHMVNEFSKEMNTPVKVIATGGLSFIFKPLHDLFDAIDVHLTLNGLLYVLERSEKL